MKWFNRNRSGPETVLADQPALTLAQLFADQGDPITEQEAMLVSAAYGAVALLADTVASLPVDAFVRDPEGSPEPLSPRPAWLGTPDAREPFLTSAECVRQLVADVLCSGDGFVWVHRDPTGRVLGWRPIPEHRVTVAHEYPADPFSRIVYSIDGTQVPAGFVVQLSAFKRSGELRGRAPLRAALWDAAASLYGARFAATLIRNFDRPAGVLRVPGQMSPAGLAMAREAWHALTSGAGVGRTPVLSEGAEYQPIHLTPADAELDGTRRLSVSSIARAFRIPPHLLGDASGSTSWGSGLAEQNAQFRQFTLQPLVSQVESALSFLLRDNANTVSTAFVKLNLDALLRPTTRERYEAHEVALRAGFMTVDEVRALEDLPPLPRPRQSPESSTGDPHPEDNSGEADASEVHAGVVA